MKVTSESKNIWNNSGIIVILKHFDGCVKLS